MSDELPEDNMEVPVPSPNPVDEAYGMEARVMLKSVRVPDADPIPESIKKEIRQIAKGHLKKYGLPQAFIAIQIGVKSESTIGEVLNGKYRADDSQFLRKINAWLEDDERRRRQDAPLGIFDTQVLIAIRDAAAIAKRYARTNPDRSVHDERPRIVMAIGPSGIGKSAGARALGAMDPNALLIRIMEKRGSATAVAKLIAESANWRNMPRQVGCLVDDIVSRLTNSGRLLIVDEAHRAQQSAFNFIRDLADVCGIPILLLGTSRMQRRIDNPRMGLGNLLDDQFSRRVAYVVDLLRGSDGKGGSRRPFFCEDEIIAIFKRDRIRLTEDAIEYLQAIACYVGCGMLGQAVNIYEKAHGVARRGNGTIDARLLRAAAEKVLMPAGVHNTEIMRQIDTQLVRNRELTGAPAKAATA